MKSSVKKIFHPVAKEFKKSKCGFNHSPADDFIRSQWQTSTKSSPYLIYRWIIALFFLIVYIISIAYIGRKSLIYFTNWGLTMCTLTNLYGACLITLWYFHPKFSDKLENFTIDKCVPLSFKIYWALHTTTLTTSLAISIIFWAVLFPGLAEFVLIDVIIIISHALNSILMIADTFIVAFPVRILHVFLPILFTLCFMIFSIIYYFAGGTDLFGHHYIYPILDWKKPGIAIGTCGAVLILFCIISFTIFAIYKLRVVIHRCIRSRTKVELPPSTPPYFDREFDLENSDNRVYYIPTTSL